MYRLADKVSLWQPLPNHTRLLDLSCTIVRHDRSQDSGIQKPPVSIDSQNCPDGAVFTLHFKVMEAHDSHFFHRSNSHCPCQRYSDVIDMEAQYITNHCNDPVCLSELSMWMDMAVSGDLPHASAALVMLMRNLANAAGGSSSRGTSSLH